MTSDTGSLNPARLRLARKRRGITKKKLALDSGLSTRSLTAYETGTQQPNALTVLRLARALDFPVEFLLREDDMQELSPDGPSFRALSRLTARQRDQAFGAAAIALLLHSWISERFDLPEVDIPKLRGVDPETAADAVRAAWGLGSLPVRNMVHSMEKHGVRMFSLAEEFSTVDAFSVWHHDLPFVFIDTKRTAERRRFDAAHELGHLVMHWRHEAPRGRDYEKEADCFASAFLMPRGSVLAEAPRGATLSQIVEAKRRWKVAAKALAYRMHALGLLTEWQYRGIFVELASRGYSEKEPNEGTPESSQILTKILAALRAEGVQLSAVAQDLAVNISDLSAVIFGLAPVSLDGGRAGSTADDERPTLRLLGPAT